MLWWAKSRPSTLIYQLGTDRAQKDHSGIIAEYSKLLKKKSLKKDEELKLRETLAGYYWDSSRVQQTVFFYYQDGTKDEATYGVENPFIEKTNEQAKRILELDPNNSSGHYYKGLCFLIRGLETFALEEFELSRAGNPKNPQPLTLLSLIQTERSNPQIGRELALQALAILPSYDDARNALIKSYLALGESEKALDEYKKLSSDTLSDPPVQAEYALTLARQNYWNESASQMQEALKHGQDDGNVFISYGLWLLEQYRWDEAAGAFAQAASIFPKAVHPVLWQTKTYALRRDCTETDRLSKIFVAYLPRWPWTSMAQAWAQLCRGYDQKALESLSEALRSSPQFYEASYLMTRIYLDKDMFGKAGEIMRPLLDQKISESEALVFLAESLFKQNQLDLSKETAQQALQLNPRNAWAHAWVGLIYAKRNDWDNAERAFVKALTLNPYDPALTAYYALMNAIKGDTTKATTLLANPTDSVAWLVKGDVARLMKNYEEALQAYQRAIDLKPYLFQAHLGVIACTTALSLTKEAQSACNRASSINPQHKELLQWRAKLFPGSR